MQQLALASHRTTKAPSAHKRQNLVPQLRQIADQLVLAIHAGQVKQARHLAHQYVLPPIAWGFLASCLQKKLIPVDVIEGVLT